MLDRQRQDEAIIVIGVFADQVDATWRTDDQPGIISETGGKFLSEAFA
jgi:hypothetical protein